MVDTVLEANLPPSTLAPGALPSRAGVGLKAEHVTDILETKPDIAFFEVHAENYMGAGGQPHAQLRSIREHYPISLHGVGMSIGCSGELSEDHLARFKRLIEIYEPGMVSEHLAWSTHGSEFLNDLLPLPYTNTTLTRIADHIDQVQEALGRTMLLENPSSYLAFAESTWEEPAFLHEIAKRTGCGLLLDVNNVFVSATNLGYRPQDYINAYPLDLVGEIHLGGHEEDEDDHGAPLLIDSHGAAVVDPVWALLDYTLARSGPKPTLVEWDTDVPDWPVLEAEAARAAAALNAVKMAA